MSSVQSNSTQSGATRLSLISRVRTDDSSAWQELVWLYTPLVAFWCRKQAMGEAEIDDTVQDVFLSVCRSIDQFQPADIGGGFRAWLWTITRNKIIDAQRRAQRAPIGRGGSTAFLASQQIPEGIDESDASERFELSSLLRRALAQVQHEFADKTWRAFWRATIDGQSVAAVATELDISPATVRQHRFRVLRRLRQQLGESL